MIFNLSVHGELLYEPAASVAAASEAEAEARGGGGSEGLPPGALPGEGEDAGPGGSNADWRATVTSAFRATLAATMRKAAASQQQREAAAAATNPRSSLGSLHGGTSRRRASLDWGEAAASPQARGANSSGSAASGSGGEGEWPPLAGRRPPGINRSIERFQQWLRLLLFRLMAVLAALPEAPEPAWVAALSSLVHLTTYEGRMVRAYAEALPLAVVAALLAQCRAGRWSEQLRAWLTCLGANLLYSTPEGDDEAASQSQRSAVYRQASAADSQGKGAGNHRSPSVAGGGSGGWAAASPAPGEAAWWPSARLDHSRLADFGGVAAVLRCYREAPTQAARRCMFAVLYDYVTGAAPPQGPDSWAPCLAHRAHASEVAALGAALLRMGAAEAAHPLFLASTGTPGGMQLIAAAVSTQMAALQEANPGRVVSAPPALVGDCMDCLDEIAARGSQVQEWGAK